jgi:predicted nucleotidyltransferase
MKHSFTQYPMQEIFGAPSHIAILRVLNQITQGISGRELARRAAINDRTCRLALGRLEQLGLVENLGTGKIKLFRLNRKNYFAKTVLPSLFVGEVSFLGSLIEKLQEALIDKCKWACIYGSVAKKMDVEFSDLDMLIIVKDEKEIENLQDKMTELISSIISGFGLSLSPVILTDFQWRKGKQFQELKKNVIQDHIPIVGQLGRLD